MRKRDRRRKTDTLRVGGRERVRKIHRQRVRKIHRQRVRKIVRHIQSVRKI